jgi:F0F1-type ATP synthase membrane subunit c/vacuolar-type H+-ATPase subunit K
VIAWMTSLFDFLPLRIFFWAVAVLFGFGGLVRGANMLSLSGYQWSAAPALWRILDVVFLVLNAVVVIGVVAQSGWAVAAFLLAAILQIVLYRVFPGQFSTTPEQIKAIRSLLFLALALIDAFVVLALIRARSY